MLKHAKNRAFWKLKIENFSNFPRWREGRQLVLGNICTALLDGVGRVSRHLGILEKKGFLFLKKAKICVLGAKNYFKSLIYY